MLVFAHKPPATFHKVDPWVVSSASWKKKNKSHSSALKYLLFPSCSTIEFLNAPVLLVKFYKVWEVLYRLIYMGKDSPDESTSKTSRLLSYPLLDFILSTQLPVRVMNASQWPRCVSFYSYELISLQLTTELI